jgi:LysR family hydrogen peroxide-inducible transcriptional activator
MNIRDLEYIIAVADLGHFSKAAEACFVSQPTLSMQIKKLEEELGVEIFERTNKRVMVTPPGQEIIQQAKEVLLSVKDLKDLAQQFKDPWGGVLRLGIIPTLGPYLLPHILPLLRMQFSQLRVTVIEGKTDTLLSMLHEGEVEAVIVSMPVETSHLTVHSLFIEPFYAVFNATSSLSCQEKICASDLYDNNILLLEEGHCLRQQVLDVCLKEKVQERENNFRLTSLETLYQIIAAEGGISLFPALAIKMRPHNPHLVVRPFVSPVPSREIALLWRTTSYRNLCCAKIGECIAHWASTQMPFLN